MKGIINSSNTKIQPSTTYTTTRGISLDITKFQKPKKYQTPKNNSKGALPLCLPFTQPKEKFHSFSPNRTNNDNSLLPPLKPIEIQTIKTLVLDLDETLIHSSFTKFPFEADIVLQVDIENQTKEVYILIRPGLDDFLERVSKCYEIVIFTAGLSKYANRLIDIIDKQRVCKYRLFREQCTLINNIYVKELKRLNRNLKNVIILDNNPNAFSLDNDNGIPIKSFMGDKSDNELVQMAYVLEKLSKVNDVRILIKELIYMNQIDYDKVLELFKHKENDDEFFIQNSQMLQPLLDKNVNSVDTAGKTGKGKVKIVSVEKVESKGNSLAHSSNFGKTFNASLKQTNTTPTNVSNSQQSMTTTSFYSTHNKTTQSPDLSGKLFRSFAQKSRSREGFYSQKKDIKITQFSNCNINQRTKDEKVKLLPKNKLNNSKNEINPNKRKIIKKKTKSSINQLAEKNGNKYSNMAEVSKEFKSIDVKDLTKRPASVIPLKVNAIFKRNDDIKDLKSQSFIKKDSIDNETSTNKEEYKSSNIPTMIFKVDNSDNKISISKGNQSSRASLHNLATTLSHPRTHRAKNTENTQCSINSKLSIRNKSINQKNKKITLKLINSQPKKTQSKTDFKILKIVSNKAVTALNRSKTSLDKLNHFNPNNKQANIK